MASQAKPRPPAQHKKKRKDAGPEKHELSLGEQMEQNQEALPPKRRHPRNRSRQQAQDEVPAVFDCVMRCFWCCVDYFPDRVIFLQFSSRFVHSQVRM